MAVYLKRFETHSEYETYISGQDATLPNVSACNDVPREAHFNPFSYKNVYLTFEILENGTLKFEYGTGLANYGSMSSSNYVEYSSDNGDTWNRTQYTDGAEVLINVTEGQKIIWRGDNSNLGTAHFYVDPSDGSSSFGGTSRFNVYGNIISLIDPVNFASVSALTNMCTFSDLFSNSKVVSAQNLLLQAMTLANESYRSLFGGCTSLTTAPELPATTLANECYEYMFGGCRNLTTSPTLPATTLAGSCYRNMFQNCTSLTTAPELPATTLASYCYDYMFNGCTSLTTAPELPATTLSNSCYSNMFYDCTSLTTAPELPATTLANYCYQYMFYGCTSLNYIKAMFTTTPSASYTSNWVNGVAATGTFVKNSAATWNVTGVNGVPTGWTVETDASL